MRESNEKQGKVIKKCHWCGTELYEKNIEELSNARGYGYYIICPDCKNRNVVKEIDLIRDFI